MTRIAVLLDVGGVLNRIPPIDRTPVEANEFQDFRLTARQGFPISYSPEMGRRLAGLDADIIWLTTWEAGDLVNKEIAPLFGWGPLPVIPRADHDNRGSWWWKSSAAEEFLLADPRPYVWLDDDLFDAERMGAIKWVESFNQPRLLISPKMGLTPSHLDQIEKWVAAETRTRRHEH